MNDYHKWSGNAYRGQEEIFRPLVENTPQIPIDKMVYQAKLMNKRLKKYLSHLMEQRKAKRTVVCDDSQTVTY